MPNTSALAIAGTSGIVLAAGAGTRAGGPKALRRTVDSTPWLALSTGVLLAAGCDRVVVVLGASAALARPLVPADPRIEVVQAHDWEAGMSVSLRAGLAAASGSAALVTLVDLPDLPLDVVRRVLAGSGPLRQAAFGGRPGHPVLIAREHWANAAASLHGDNGARAYLSAHGVAEIECGDLWDNADRDNS